MTTSATSVPLEPAGDAARSRFRKVAWGSLVFTLGVILFGAVVRITGSGAGCGQHWPTCQGSLLVLPRGVKMAIEYTHRTTSGLSLVLVLVTGALAWRTYPRGHGARRAAGAAVLFMLVEAFIGAVLVRRALVADNVSVARAAVMSLHLVNTTLLTGSMALSAFGAARPVPRLRPSCPLEWLLAGGLVAAVAVSITGAITALGDTLFPVETARPLAERLAADYSATATFLERGRAVHPLAAFLIGTWLLVLAWKTSEIRPHRAVVRRAHVVMGLVFAQMAAGVVNILLSAPGYMQVLHLGLGLTLWLALVLLYVEARIAKPT
jgi:cytochrome c oxidase assembly protein subunit 15/protoheme IX farnesyltransferase